ncbi:MAG: sigma-70 family RNA polymerase sigma factor [Muribaculaceae bacterium]|nr:sigma-70 family RNA polymerase sigma factor [Muribaculaceae bacterium]
MELTQDKIDLISRIIRNDRKYPNNEDLYDDFFNETCKRSVAILGAIESETTLEPYLKRVVTTSIINVLKDSGRLRRTKSGYMSTKEVVTSNTEQTVDYSSIVIDYSSVNIPQNPEEIVIQKELLDFVAKTIKQIDSEEPDKNYLHIYTLRYDKGMTQKEISEELGLSQGEISKRLYSLMDKVKHTIE